MGSGAAFQKIRRMIFLPFRRKHPCHSPLRVCVPLLLEKQAPFCYAVLIEQAERSLLFMLHETLRALRKKKGYSQEETASRLNVVRQTVSKWEKGLSVPDADMLVRLAELYEITVGELLGASPVQEETPELPQPNMHEIAEQLSRINEQLVIKNRRSSRIWKIVGGILIGWILLHLIGAVLSIAAFSVLRIENTETGQVVEEQYEPGGAENTLTLP